MGRVKATLALLALLVAIIPYHAQGEVNQATRDKVSTTLTSANAALDVVKSFLDPNNSIH